MVRACVPACQPLSPGLRACGARGGRAGQGRAGCALGMARLQRKPWPSIGQAPAEALIGGLLCAAAGDGAGNCEALGPTTGHFQGAHAPRLAARRAGRCVCRSHVGVARRPCARGMQPLVPAAAFGRAPAAGICVRCECMPCFHGSAHLPSAAPQVYKAKDRTKSFWIEHWMALLEAVSLLQPWTGGCIGRCLMACGPGQAMGSLHAMPWHRSRSCPSARAPRTSRTHAWHTRGTRCVCVPCAQASTSTAPRCCSR